MTCSNSDQDMTATAGLWSTNENFHGIVVSNSSACWYGKTLTGLKIKLKKEGADTSDNFYFRIYDSSGTLQASSNGVAQSSLTTSMEEIELDMTSGTSYSIQVGDRIGIWYDGGSSSAGKIRSQKSNSVTSYDNTSVDGSMMAVGMDKVLDNGMFFRVEGQYSEFDSASLTSSSGSQKITMESLDGVIGKISVGKAF